MSDARPPMPDAWTNPEAWDQFLDGNFMHNVGNFRVICLTSARGGHPHEGEWYAGFDFRSDLGAHVDMIASDNFEDSLGTARQIQAITEKGEDGKGYATETEAQRELDLIVEYHNYWHGRPPLYVGQ